MRITVEMDVPNMIVNDSDTPAGRENLRRILRTMVDKVIDTIGQSEMPDIPATVLHSSSLILSQECAVCLEPIRLFSTVRIPPCRHGFHASCLQEMIQHNHMCCPMCRKSFFIT